MLKSIAKQFVIALRTNIYETSVIVFHLDNIANATTPLDHTAS